MISAAAPSPTIALGRSHTLGFVVENRTRLAGRSAEGEQHRRTVRMSSTEGEGEQYRGTTISSRRRTATVGDLDGEGSDGEGRRSRLGDGRRRTAGDLISLPFSLFFFLLLVV
ncbi:hypothetical protein LWI29_016497 [Acer saccharum]|uniref:Uncharacterized protein n=1 Tax=Acer saccharum TaxID=4024 RepID=A0AA39SNG1_ACESA|nr:hypothetical protein LWI29_016497 [Acer saccharum]